MNVKKCLASVLSGLLIVGSVGYSPSNDKYNKSYISIAEGADIETDTSWYDAEETEFHISTEQELLGLAQCCNTKKSFKDKTVFIEKDISIPTNKWKTINSFDGTIEGNGHTIQGAGGFININNGIIKNIKTDKSVIANENNGTISNCIVNGDVFRYSNNGYKHAAKLYTGGIVGKNNKSGIIENCVSNVKCTVYYDEQYTSYPGTTNHYLGGICGMNEGKIYRCGNNGNISFYCMAWSEKLITDISNYVFQGGICGECSSNGSISECYNKGAIFSTRDTKTFVYGIKYWYAGGICGRSYASMSDLYNYGNVYYELKPTANISACICGQLSGSLINAYNAVNVESSKQICEYAIARINDNKTQLTNCYYLNTSANKGDTKDVSIAKSDENMRKETFANSLGDAFVYVQNEYPKLAWETGRINSKFDPESIELNEYGQQRVLSLNTTYSGEVTWISSNTNVVTFKDGVVTAVGNGEATIYAMYDNSKVTGYVKVNYDYYLDKTEIELLEEKTGNINLFSKATNAKTNVITPTYKSSDNKIATINEKGEITAISQGSCTITASFLDKSLTCNVTVKPDPDKVVIPEPKLSSNTLSIEQGAKSNISVQNFSGSTVTWVSDDTKIATVSKQSNGLSATVSGVGAGTVKIYAMLSTGQTLVCNVTVKQGTTTTTKLTTTTTKPTTTTTKKTTTTTKKTTTTTKKTTTTTKKTTTTTKKTTTTTKKTTTTTKKTTTTTKRTTTTTKKITTTVKVTTTTQPISIGKTEITMKNGEQYAIPANRTDLTYKSNNNDIAIVSSKGIITAVGTGNAIISVIDSEWNVVQINVTVTTSAKQGLPGDSNMDNQVDLSDVVLIMQSLANPNKYGLSGSDKSHLTEQGAANADVEGGNGITANDALIIQQYLLKIITKLPV